MFFKFYPLPHSPQGLPSPSAPAPVWSPRQDQLLGQAVTRRTLRCAAGSSSRESQGQQGTLELPHFHRGMLVFQAGQKVPVHSLRQSRA